MKLKNTFISPLTVLFFCIQLSNAQDSISTQERAWHKRQGVQLLAAPSLLVGYGLYVYGNHGFYSSDDSYRDIQRNAPNFHTNIDNVTQFAPIVAIFGLNLIGIKGKNPLLPATCLHASSLVLNTLIVQGLKHSISELRPDGSAYNSFPSGHTSTAFVAAECFHQEYGKKSIWYSVAGYTVATITGALRMYNNKHWQSDVLVGAGIGIFCTKLSYLGYSKMLKKKKGKILD